MPRKRKEYSDSFYTAFPANLRRLMLENGMTQKALGDRIGKSRQQISFYCDGSSSPDWEGLVEIANVFSVSVDWLLGRSTVKKIDPNMEAMTQYTHLPEGALRMFHYELNGRDHRQISGIFDSRLFRAIIKYFFLWSDASQAMALIQQIESQIKRYVPCENFDKLCGKENADYQQMVSDNLANWQAERSEKIKSFVESCILNEHISSAIETQLKLESIYDAKRGNFITDFIIADTLNPNDTGGYSIDDIAYSRLSNTFLHFLDEIKFTNEALAKEALENGNYSKAK